MGKCLPLWGEGGRGPDRGRMRLSLPLHPVSGWPGKGRPSSVTFGDSFPPRGEAFENSIIHNPPPQTLAYRPKNLRGRVCIYCLISAHTSRAVVLGTAVGRDRYAVDRDGGLLGGGGRCRCRHRPSPCPRRPWRPQRPCPDRPARTLCRCCQDTAARPRRRRPRSARRCSRWRSARPAGHCCSALSGRAVTK